MKIIYLLQESSYGESWIIRAYTNMKDAEKAKLRKEQKLFPIPDGKYCYSEVVFPETFTKVWGNKSCEIECALYDHTKNLIPEYLEQENYEYDIICMELQGVFDEKTL